jgi:ABC-type uncharacterized transport system permease subunit
LTGLGLAFLFDVLGIEDIAVDFALGLVAVVFVVACFAGWHWWRGYRAQFARRREQARRRRAALR